MENASKALIIAGAILLSILIISLGLMVYNQAKNTIGSVNLDAQQIEQFNETFLRYEGTAQSAANVNALIQNVISSNQTAINNATGAYVSITFPTVSDPKGERTITISVNENVTDLTYLNGKNEATTDICKVATGKTYKVVVTREKSIVSSIAVTANT